MPGSLRRASVFLRSSTASAMWPYAVPVSLRAPVVVDGELELPRPGGDAEEVVTAARIGAAASPGEILVSPRHSTASERTSGWPKPRKETLKGFETPVD
jgi:hypothetical protein